MDPTAATDASARALRERLHTHCFACAPENEAGLGLVFHTGADSVTRAVWQPAEAFQSYGGRVHGGILATLIDASMVHALFARGVAGVTAEMHVRYRSPAALNAPIEIATRLESVKHGLYFLAAEIRQAGRIAAQARAKFMAL